MLSICLHLAITCLFLFFLQMLGARCPSHSPGLCSFSRDGLGALDFCLTSLVVPAIFHTNEELRKHVPQGVDFIRTAAVGNACALLLVQRKRPFRVPTMHHQ